MSEMEFVPYQQSEIEKTVGQPNDYIKHFKVFDEYEKFQSLSLRAILIYEYAVDKLALSEQRGELLTDKDGIPFILANEEELAKFARCNVKQIPKLKKQLMDFGLIKQNKNENDGIYVGQIQIFSSDKRIHTNFEF